MEINNHLIIIFNKIKHHLLNLIVEPVKLIKSHKTLNHY